MRRAILLVSSRGAVMLVPAYLWAVLGAIMLATCLLVGGWSEPAKVAPPPAQYSITDLGTLPGGEFSIAHDINDLGHVVGSSCTDSVCHAVLWQNGKMTDLGTLPGGDHSNATAINDRGHVVGWSGTAPLEGEESGPQHAFLWKNGKMTDLGNLPRKFFSFAQDINYGGQVVGSSEAAGSTRAFLWDKGKMTDLGILSGGGEFSSAHGINDRGQVVGWSNDHAVLWTK